MEEKSTQNRQRAQSAGVVQSGGSFGGSLLWGSFVCTTPLDYFQ